MIFKNRREAGRQLAERLSVYAKQPDVLLFALPRGGVIVGEELARALGLRLDVMVTRKIGSPDNPEYAIGALAETGETVWNEEERQFVDPQVLDEIIQKEMVEAARRVKRYRGGKPLPNCQGKTVILIDDGVATGFTMRAAIAALKHQQPLKIIIAVPHGASDTLEELRKEVDEVIVLSEPTWYGAVGQFYEDFPQVSDEEVLRALKEH